MSLSPWKPDDIVERDSSKNADDIICNEAVQKRFFGPAGRANVSLLCKCVTFMQMCHFMHMCHFMQICIIYALALCICGRNNIFVNLNPAILW